MPSELMMAVQAQDFQQAAILLKKNKSARDGINDQEIISQDLKLTVLLTAAYTSNTKMLTLLLTYKADVSIVDDKGNTPLHISASKGRLTEVKELLRKNAQVNVVNNDQMTPYNLAMVHGYMNVVNELSEPVNGIVVGADSEVTVTHGIVLA